MNKTAPEIEITVGTITAVDIPTMARMTEDEYINYMKYNSFYVDHHDVLRSEKSGRPLATSISQLDLLIEYLTYLRTKMRD